MTEQEYRQADGLSGTELKNLYRSAGHYWQEKNNPKESTSSQIFGTAAHMAILEPDKFQSNYIVFDDTDILELCVTQKGEKSKNPRNTDCYKYWLSEFSELNIGKTLLSTDDYNRIIAIQTAVKNNKSAQKYLTDGIAEKPLFWEYNDLKCKGKPDYVSCAVVDVKICQDSRMAAFSRDIWKYLYHLQAAHYVNGEEIISGKRLPFVFIAIEVEPPHGIGVYVLDENDIELGISEIDRLTTILKQCKSTGIWNVYSDEIRRISLPDYAGVTDN